MPRGCAICLKSTSHAHRDNDHEGNSPENGIYRKFDVEALRRNLGGLRPVAGQRCQTKRGASQGAATSTKSDAQSIYELPSSFTCRLDQILRAGDNGVRIAPNTIHSNRWRSIAHAALYFGCVPSENAGFGWGKFSFGHHSHSFRPEMAGAHCLRYQPPDRRSRGEGEHRSQCRGPRKCRRCHRAGGICTTATVKPATRCQKARTEAATPTQNCKETRPPACTLCSEASAI